MGKYEVTLGQFIHMSRRAAKYPHEFAGRFVENGDEMNAPAVMWGGKKLMTHAGFSIVNTVICCEMVIYFGSQQKANGTKLRDAEMIGYIHGQ